MNLINRFFNQTRKPEGVLGKLMLRSMNSGHARLADWGMSHLPAQSVSRAVDLGCGAGRNAGELLKRYPAAELEAALRNAGFSEVRADHHGKKPWITVLAKK